jgi:hypothetical protein
VCAPAIRERRNALLDREKLLFLATDPLNRRTAHDLEALLDPLEELVANLSILLQYGVTASAFGRHGRGIERRPVFDIDQPSSASIPAPGGGPRATT